MGMSLWFYGYFNVSYLLIIVTSILFNFGIYKLIEKKRGTKWCKVTMIAGVVINLGILGYFKYMDFFIGNINALFKTDLVPLISLQQIMLPIPQRKRQSPSQKPPAVLSVWRLHCPLVLPSL